MRVQVAPDDGYMLESRPGDAGKDNSGGNADGKTHQPLYMFDEQKMDSSPSRPTARPAGQIYNLFLVCEQKAVPFDPNAGWQEGDLIPDHIVSREDAKGSAAHNNGGGSWKDGKWTVVLTRPLGLTNADDKMLRASGVYNVGFAVHDDNITTRGHQISFVKTLSLGAKKADIQAVKLP